MTQEIEPASTVVSPTGGTPQAAGADALEGRPAVDAETEAVSHPARLMRIGSMAKALLDEVRAAPLDQAGRERMRDIYNESVRQLADALSPELTDELGRLSIPLDAEPPTDAELRVAQAQLVGWLEGLFQGIQASLFVQQMAAQRQLEQMRQQPPAIEQDGPRRAAPYL